MNSALLSLALTALLALSAGGSAEEASVTPASRPEAVVQA